MKIVPVIDGIRTELINEDLDRDGKTGGTERIQKRIDEGTIPIKESSERYQDQPLHHDTPQEMSRVTAQNPHQDTRLHGSCHPLSKILGQRSEKKTKVSAFSRNVPSSHGPFTDVRITCSASASAGLPKKPAPYPVLDQPRYPC